MRMSNLVVGAAAIITLSVSPAHAQGRGGGHAQHATVPHTTSRPTTTTPAPTTSAAATTVAKTNVPPPHLAARLQPLLPKGMTMTQAAAGFKNQGQFVAALHVSKNLGIPFADLKRTMLGTSKTSTSPLSLGQAIHKLRPKVDADTEVEHATTQATVDVKATSTTTSGK